MKHLILLSVMILAFVIVAPGDLLSFDEQIPSDDAVVLVVDIEYATLAGCPLRMPILVEYSNSLSITSQRQAQDYRGFDINCDSVLETRPSERIPTKFV